MNAFTRSASSMAATIASVGRQRVKQTVRIVTRDTLDGITFYLVAVNEGPERYRVSQAFLDRLYAGQTPEYLELEDEPTEVEATPEYPAADRACSRADWLYQSDKEQF